MKIKQWLVGIIVVSFIVIFPRISVAQSDIDQGRGSTGLAWSYYTKYDVIRVYGYTDAYLVTTSETFGCITPNRHRSLI